MRVWHAPPDTPRSPEHSAAGGRTTVRVGSWPIGPGQSVWLDRQITPRAGKPALQRVDCVWETNEGLNSYWQASLGPFGRGDTVTYAARARTSEGEVEADTGPVAFTVRPWLHLALLWHQHPALLPFR
jgi:hypothetical protein